jgi:non-specific serine/threonine protein kinase
MPFAFIPVLTPHGHLLLEREEAETVDDGSLTARLEKAFARGSGHGLLQLGTGEAGTALPPGLGWWRNFAMQYVTALRTLPEVPEISATGAQSVDINVPLSPESVWIRLVDEAPPMKGGEYLSADVLKALWGTLDAALSVELAETGLSVRDFLKRRNPELNFVGRVHFNLAENRKDEDWPFAFLATYTTGLSARGQAKHLPLGQALREYAGASNKASLLNLLLPVQRAAESCPWLKAIVDSGEIFHPLRWKPQDAIHFLQDVAALEHAGVVVRMPANWRMNRPARPVIKATVGGKAPSAIGMDALLDFRMEVTLEGETLTESEIQDILAQSDGLALVRGKWIEVDRARLQDTLAKFQSIEKTAALEGLSFVEAMRLLAGAGIGEPAVADASVSWAEIAAGPWLEETLKGLRSPEGLAKVDPGRALHATLRPYQYAGVQWLHLLTQLGLGACLADDMGLGKTIQVLALLLVLESTGKRKQPSLLVAPTSLLANWAAEAARFAPSLRTLIAHPSALPAEELRSLSADRAVAADLVITSYGTLLRLPWLTETSWQLAVLDEAQAIKNPGAKQTKAVKALKAKARIALTGTPIENRLGDLWSLFDFVNPGLLGSAKQFSDFAKRLGDQAPNSYAPLRTLVRPYILRRLKTDKSVIADLPDKTEVKAFCQLSRKQAALYQQAVDELARQLKMAREGIARKGLVLSFLMRLKQICNHPSQWLGDGGWDEEDSGKLTRLREIAEILAARQEKVLIFTQFKETTAPLAAFLADVFGRPGLVLHGETQVAKRQELVKTFHDDEIVPFFVLSLKAGGAGLNLTAASHVIHFDRWWNPAVENQATDRAFRIGQKKNVLVHKFVCTGTVEDKIDQIIESKKKLAGDFLESGGEINLTTISDKELLNLVALDLGAMAKEA